MTGDPKDCDRAVHKNDNPAAKFIEQWIKFRESQGMTPEAAMREFAAVRSMLVAMSRDQER
jgi:hypothetical protein